MVIYGKQKRWDKGVEVHDGLYKVSHAQMHTPPPTKITAAPNDGWGTLVCEIIWGDHEILWGTDMTEHIHVGKGQAAAKYGPAASHS